VNGELAQLVALAAHGNAFLAGLEQESPELEAGATFRYTSSLQFVDDDVVSTTTSAWFEVLRDEGVSRLEVATAPTRRNFVAFANAGRWWLVAGDRSWRGEWSVTDAQASDHRIWSAVYRVFDPPDADDAQDVANARSRLEEALADVSDFCDRHSTGFEEHFERAARLLDSPAPKIPYYDDVLPTRGYDLATRQLLAAATEADLFGGIGSWNDLGFDQPDVEAEYGAVSDRLFEAVIDATVAAANSFDRSSA
jgi:hypothetical protein